MTEPVKKSLSSILKTAMEAKNANKATKTKKSKNTSIDNGGNELKTQNQNKPKVTRRSSRGG
jgi:hypothetical protein